MGDIPDQGVGGLDLIRDMFQGFAHLGRTNRSVPAALRSVTTAGNRSLDLAGGFPGGCRTALRQRTHLIRHHRKTSSRLACPGRFHRGIQGQDVRLEGNLVDVLYDLRHFRAGGVNRGHGPVHLLHRGRHLLHCLEAGLSHRTGLMGQLLCLLGVFRCGSDHAGHLLQRSTGLFHRGGLFTRGRRKSLAGGRDLLGRSGRLKGPLIKICGQFLQDIIGGSGDQPGQKYAQRHGNEQEDSNQGERDSGGGFSILRLRF